MRLYSLIDSIYYDEPADCISFWNKARGINNNSSYSNFI